MTWHCWRHLPRATPKLGCSRRESKVQTHLVCYGPDRTPSHPTLPAPPPSPNPVVDLSPWLRSSASPPPLDGEGRARPSAHLFFPRLPATECTVRRAGEAAPPPQRPLLFTVRRLGIWIPQLRPLAGTCSSASELETMAAAAVAVQRLPHQREAAEGEPP
jgi:hypothetical protein